MGDRAKNLKDVNTSHHKPPGGGYRLSGSSGHSQDALLAQAGYYHGLLPRPDMKAMLRKTGDFLVRMSEPHAGEPRQYILSVQTREELEENGIKHFIIREVKGKFIIEKGCFTNVRSLIEHHLNTQDVVTKASNAVLLRPIEQQPWERRHETVELEKKLGEGAFGEVYSGKLKLADGSIVPVAVKLAKMESLTKEQIKEIMHEARLLRNFDHPNIVKCYGVAAQQEPLMVLMELADGSLDSYLQKKPQANETKYEMMAQSAFGIEYIHKSEVLHRDIAARNCLYGKGVVKIADFGLSREGTCYAMSLTKRVPIRWISPETLASGLYTVKTDVYAFGILCWEIFNNGIEPYPGMTVAEVNMRVREGYRMELGTADNPCNPDIKDIVLKRCWPSNPNERSTMTDICKFFERILHIKRPDVAPRGKENEQVSTESNSRTSVVEREKPATNVMNVERCTSGTNKNKKLDKTQNRRAAKDKKR